MHAGPALLCQNPCNSPLHPAARAGIKPDEEEVLSVQVAYTPKSTCFGCGASRAALPLCLWLPGNCLASAA